MEIRYDLHIHSGLSPCADNDMTPTNIVGFAKLNGIDMIAVSDHNGIANVEVAMRAGEAFGVTVVPAMELQSAEEIHFLCLFQTFADLKNFYDKLCFLHIKNRPELYGEQLIFDEDDNVVEKVEDLLLVSSTLSSTQVKPLADAFGGIAVPAHIDREANGMVQILGEVTDEFNVVELSASATDEQIQLYSKTRKILIDSDAHALSQIQGRGRMELKENSAAALLERLKS